MTSSDQTIFTLDARDNFRLELIRDYFGADAQNVRESIRRLHYDACGILNRKGVPYEQLKAGLVPCTKNHEAAFLFDSRRIVSACYGIAVADVLLPLLDMRSTRSLLSGDLISNNNGLALDEILDSVVPARSSYLSHCSQIYCVYINNLTSNAVESLHSALCNYMPYIGYIPTTFSTPAKIYLSGILVGSFLQWKNVAIMGHEDECPNKDNINVMGLPFEEHGFRVVSLQSCYYDIFLKYKIERPISRGRDVDTAISLNAISTDIKSLDTFAVDIASAKMDYLKREKLDKLKLAGISDMSPLELSGLLRAKLMQNYIYNLCWLSDYDVAKFNVIIEVPRFDDGYPSRLLVALEYRPSENVLRVITLY
jgi:hypothetical protein